MLSIGQLIDLTGVAVGAVSGALVAGRHRFDWLGVAVIAGVTAIGGGTVRDLLLAREVFWVQDPVFLYVILLTTGLVMLFGSRHPLQGRALELADAVVLAVFGIAGARIAQSLGRADAIAVLMGMITGSFGGVLRDVLCNEVPMILHRGALYASAVIAGCSVYVLLGHTTLNAQLTTALGMATIFAVRGGAIAYNWRLPVFSLPPDAPRDE